MFNGLIVTVDPQLYDLASVMTVLVIACAKLSVLSLYYRVFVIKAFRDWTVVIGVVCLLWGIIIAFTTTFNCTPVSASWEIPSVGHCISYSLLVVMAEALNCVQDLIIVCMPIGVIRHLQLSLRKKILLVVVFPLGGLYVLSYSSTLV